MCTKNINLIDDAVTIRIRCSVTAIISNPHYILVLYSRTRLYKIEHRNFFTESLTSIWINRRPVSWGYCRMNAYSIYYRSSRAEMMELYTNVTVYLSC